MAIYSLLSIAKRRKQNANSKLNVNSEQTVSTCQNDMKKPSATVVCCIYLLTLLTNVSIEANNVDQDQSVLGPHCLSEASKPFHQMTKIIQF